MHWKGLWATFEHHGEVIDAFIRIKKSSRDKRMSVSFANCNERIKLWKKVHSGGTGNENVRKKKHQALFDNRSKERKRLKLSSGHYEQRY
ncbi:hypothetical protein V6N13_034357 [Hibiscus sabdariffa]